MHFSAHFSAHFYAPSEVCLEAAAVTQPRVGGRGEGQRAAAKSKNPPDGQIHVGREPKKSSLPRKKIENKIKILRKSSEEER